MGVNQKIIKEIESLKNSIEEISVYNLDVYSSLELYYNIAKKLNEIIRELSRFEGLISNEIINQNEKLTYLLDKGLKVAVVNQLQTWFDNGVLQNIINVGIFNELNDNINNISKVATKDLKKSFNDINDGETLVISGDFTVDQIAIRNKKNVTLKFKGTISQKVTVKDDYSYDHALSNQPLFVIENCENIIIEDYKALPQYEGIYINNSSATIRGGKIDGQHKSTFNAFHVYSKKDVIIDGVTIENCGVMPVWNGSVNPYAMGGHGFHLSVSEHITIQNCVARNNAMNGIFLFACSNITLTNNLCERNGMSGIQIAFGGDYCTNYKVINNTCLDNFSDGLDINNGTDTTHRINAVIQGNIFKNNGFMGQYVTQDGSGVATLVNVTDVTIIGNECYNPARSGLYIRKCSNINISSNIIEKINNVSENVYLENCKDMIITGNKFSSVGEGVKFYGNNKNIRIVNNTIIADSSLVLPNEIGLDNVVVENNYMELKTSINCQVDLINNIIVNKTSIVDSIYIAKDNCKIINNKITGGYRAIHCFNRNNCQIKNNIIDTNGISILIRGTSSNNIISENHITTKEQAPNLHIAEINCNDNYILKNIFVSNGGNSLRLEPNNCGTTYLDNNTVIGDGFVEEGNGRVLKTQYI